MAEKDSARAEDGQRVRNRRGQGEKLREQLIDAASALITESGDAGSLSLRAVAARAGVAPPSVYLHFADLADIKMAVANRSFAEFNALRAAAANASTSAMALIAGCQAYVQYALTHQGHYRLMFGPDLPPLTGQQGTANREAFENLISSIRRCQSEGEADTDIAPERLAWMVWASLHGQASLRIDRPYMPWPPIEPMIAELVTRLVGIGRD